MTSLSSVPGEQLASALHKLNIRYTMGVQGTEETISDQPPHLIAALAQSDEARLRLALIPLFLQYPEFALHVPAAVRLLSSPAARVVLQCYYTAARILHRIYFPTEAPLPDHFSKELNLSLTHAPLENLRRLAERHRQLSGMKVNWLGTYLHGAQLWLKGSARKGRNSK